MNLHLFHGVFGQRFCLKTAFLHRTSGRRCRTPTWGSSVWTKTKTGRPCPSLGSWWSSAILMNLWKLIQLWKCLHKSHHLFLLPVSFLLLQTQGNSLLASNTSPFLLAFSHLHIHENLKLRININLLTPSTIFIFLFIPLQLLLYKIDRLQH